DLRSSMRTVTQRMRRTIDEMVKSTSVQNYLQDQIVTMRNDRLCLSVRADAAQHVRGIVHDQSASGATYFIEPERVASLGNELRRYALLEEREIERILSELSAYAAPNADVLLEAFEVLGAFDFAIAKAAYAHAERAVKPELDEQPILQLVQARHPHLDLARAVPLDIRLGDSFTQLLITGPNTGGKTVSLKTMGLLTIMGLSGLYVTAAQGTRIGWFDEVYADIGDEQSIEQSLSTFSSHMTNIIRILREASPTSLVLFDEIGAGTDPTEGASLAMAILDELRARGIRTVATTHYSELKAYAYTTPGTINASVSFDVETLTPTYRLELGIPGKSYAFAIAERLGLPQTLIEQARARLTTTDERVEDLISHLTQRVHDAREDHEQAHRARQDVERLREQLEERARIEEEERMSRKKKADEEIRAYVKRSQREADDLIAQLREMATSGAVKDHELTAVRGRMRALAPDPTLVMAPRKRSNETLAEGDEVRVLSLAGQKGSLMSEVGRDEWLVAIGSMKLRVNRKNMELLRRAEKVEAPVVMVKRASEGVSPTLDVRGQTVQEAMVEVDRYLDKAVLSGYHQVTIVHGKGTGALREGLLLYLRTHRRVRTYRQGGEGEGGSGVTVIELA
ncbi:endonuclease MutS2, partial [Ferroacidibacillus organovorans]